MQLKAGIAGPDAPMLSPLILDALSPIYQYSVHILLQCWSLKATQDDWDLITGRANMQYCEKYEALSCITAQSAPANIIPSTAP